MQLPFLLENHGKTLAFQSYRPIALTSISCDRALPWLCDFLRDRSIRVKFNSSMSKGFKLSQSLPQGSVRAPLPSLCSCGVVKKSPEGVNTESSGLVDNFLGKKKMYGPEWHPTHLPLADAKTFSQNSLVELTDLFSRDNHCLFSP
ncbi:hypothetical protein TNCV_2556981 [Trichonephila clavipes]|nr:hypothetical protein TNCV_2556981 [Trichonephila clavipes]